MGQFMPLQLHLSSLRAHAPAMFDPTRFAPQYPPDLGLEPLHLEIDLHLDLAQATAQGIDTE
jgi:hypothetical protein